MKTLNFTLWYRYKHVSGTISNLICISNEWKLDAFTYSKKQNEFKMIQIVSKINKFLFNWFEIYKYWNKEIPQILVKERGREEGFEMEQLGLEIFEEEVRKIFIRKFFIFFSFNLPIFNILQ